MPQDFLTAERAAELLGVKRETLYAYVSRGWLESITDPDSHRSRLYKKADLLRLLARANARAGDGPVAAAALRWGSPVLKTSICRVTYDGPEYRGTPLAELVDGSYESCAELLVGHDLERSTNTRGQWALPDDALPLDVLRAALIDAELRDPDRHDSTDEASRRITSRVFETMVGGLEHWSGAPGDRAGTVAKRVARALGGDAGNPAVVRAVERTLIVCAEHELNVSAFASRVTASTGANLYACITAALAAFTGGLHGRAAERVRLLLDDARGEAIDQRLAERLRVGGAVPGLGHPLYPAGDPRFEMLLSAAQTVDADATRPVSSFADATGALGLERPNLDVGLVAICDACRLVDGAAAALFAIGRTAGWIAHAREQRSQGFLLRPRATYTEP